MRAWSRGISVRRRKEFHSRRLLAVVCFVCIICGQCFLSDASLPWEKITRPVALANIVKTSCVLDCAGVSENGRRIVSDAHDGRLVPNRIPFPNIVTPDPSCIMSVLASHTRRYPFRTARGVTLVRDTQRPSFTPNGCGWLAVACPWFCMECVVLELCPERPPHVAFVDMWKMVWMGCSVAFPL